MRLEDLKLIAENDAGVEFCVGRLGNRWVGVAITAGDAGERMVFVYFEVSEGVVLGLPDKAAAIQRTALLAAREDFGGVDRWMIGGRLRPKPGDIDRATCDQCGSLFCDEIECYESRRRAAMCRDGDGLVSHDFLGNECRNDVKSSN